jgi:hypothetical protein
MWQRRAANNTPNNQKESNSFDSVKMVNVIRWRGFARRKGTKHLKSEDNCLLLIRLLSRRYSASKGAAWYSCSTDLHIALSPLGFDWSIPGDAISRSFITAKNVSPDVSSPLKTNAKTNHAKGSSPAFNSRSSSDLRLFSKGSGFPFVFHEAETTLCIPARKWREIQVEVREMRSILWPEYRWLWAICIIFAGQEIRFDISRSRKPRDEISLLTRSDKIAEGPCGNGSLDCIGNCGFSFSSGHSSKSWMFPLSKRITVQGHSDQTWRISILWTWDPI